MFEGMVHRDNLDKFADLLAAQMLTPRFADDDFTRNRQDALDYVTKTLRGNADEDLGKQAMATVLYQRPPLRPPVAGDGGGPDGHHARRRAQASRDVLHARSPDRRRRGRLPGRLRRGVRAPVQGAARQVAAADEAAAAARAEGNQLLVVEKDARANAISFGHADRRSRARDPDFYPLTVARSYLGEHRTFNGVLMNHLRERRALNYGDYAYIENFIQDGWSTFPLPNIPRRQQHFEIWLRPVPPQNSLFALRAALFETDKLIREGIPQAGVRRHAHLPDQLLQPVGAGRVAPARLRHRRRRVRQGPGQGAAGAAAQDEEGRRRPRDPQVPVAVRADDRHRRRQGAGGRRQAGQRRPDRASPTTPAARPNR